MKTIDKLMEALGYAPETELMRLQRLVSGLNAVIGEQRAEIKELQQRLLQVTRGNKS